MGLTFFVPLTAKAAEVAELAGTTSIPEYVAFVLNTIMLSAASLSILVITIGGLYWLVSLGMSKVTNEGKEWVKAGLFGLILTTGAYIFVKAINPEILSFAKISWVPIQIPWIHVDPPVTRGTTQNLSFDEIPIGVLAENLVARGMRCYDFNGSGEPIDGDVSTADEWEPTFFNHDRMDCVLKLAEAVEKKAKLFDLLSEKIAEVMNTCSCGGGGGDCKLAGGCNCSYPGAAVQKGASCVPNTCPSDCESKPCIGKQCCSADAIKKMEHGPMTLDDNGCGGTCQTCQSDCEKNFKTRTGQECGQECKKACADTCKEACEYAGLDEFRSQFADSAILDAVEKEIEVDGSDEKIKIIDKEAWKKLRLVDKLKYLSEKIKDINLEKDLNNLKTAKTKVNNNCYFGSSAVKFLIDSATINKEKFTTSTNNGFTDQVTKKPVDISKYCEGFGYSNSSCFYYCQKTCDPITEAGQQCFKNCSSCTGDKNTETYKTCVTNQKKCLSDCINNASCTEESGFNGFYKEAAANGEENKQYCVGACKISCSKDCDAKYSNCPDALKECKDACVANSKSLIANRDRTYLATTDIKTCADNFSDFPQFKRCAEFALQGRYCSNQNPGDPDVFKDPVWPATMMPNNGDYSSLYFYNHQSQQKCPNCTQKIDPATGKVEIDPTTKKATTSGIQQFQECWKGPSCSYIPKAPCTDDACTPGALDLNLLNCSSTCEKFSYSGEPLTYYCPSAHTATQWMQDIWDRQTDMYCQKNTEVPVGQTVDGALAWGNELEKYAAAFRQKTSALVQLIKQIADERDYCKCDSPCGDGKTACQATCDLSETPASDENGDTIGVNCACVKSNCDGSPCQKMLNLMLGKKAEDKCPKGTEYKGIKDYANKISESLASLKNSSLPLARAEVLKRLSYSRKKMDENSVKIKITPDKTISIFSCYQIQNKLFPTIINDDVVINNKKIPGYCYGEKVSAYLQPGNLLLDNWFSCEKQQQEEN